jgi:chemotaxis signal transduction protein
MNAGMNGDNAARSSFVLLRIGNKRFALPADTVTELAPPVRLHAFPHKSPLIAGVVVRRGRIVPVYDAGPVLIGRESPTHRFYLIARREFGGTSEPSGIPVNGECELAAAEMLPPDDGAPNYVAGKLSIGGESVPVLNLEAVLTAQPAEAEARP